VKLGVPIFGGDGNVLFQLAGAQALSNSTMNKDVHIIDFRCGVVPLMYKLLGWTMHDSFIELSTITTFPVRQPTIIDIGVFLLAYLRYRLFPRSQRWAKCHVSYFQDPSELDKASIKGIAEKLGRQFQVGEVSFPRLAIHFRGGDFSDESQNSQFEEIVKLLALYPGKEAFIITNDLSKVSTLRVKAISSDPISDFCFIAESDFCFGIDSSFSFWAFLINVESKCVFTVKGGLIDRFSSLVDCKVHLL
jgi:hypothetical protein